MIDVRKNALQMLEDGMSLKAVAACSGTTEAQVKEWCDEDCEKQRKNPVLALMHRGMTCAEIVAELGCSPETAHDLVVTEWRKQKEGRS